MADILQVAGAVVILVAFIGAQRGALSQHSVAYLVLNLAGSALLGVLALIGRDWGFLLLEGVWALVSAHSLARILRERPPPVAR